MPIATHVAANSAHRLRANSSLVLSTMVGAAFIFCTYLACRTAAALSSSCLATSFVYQFTLLCTVALYQYCAFAIFPSFVSVMFSLRTRRGVVSPSGSTNSRHALCFTCGSPPARVTRPSIEHTSGHPCRSACHCARWWCGRTPVTLLVALCESAPALPVAQSLPGLERDGGQARGGASMRRGWKRRKLFGEENERERERGND